MIAIIYFHFFQSHSINHTELSSSSISNLDLTENKRKRFKEIKESVSTDLDLDLEEKLSSPSVSNFDLTKENKKKDSKR